jgi:hypothetical protein
VSRRVRIALGAALLCYLPFFAYVVVVTTPAYATLRWVAVFVLPPALASFCAALLLSVRAVRPTAWAVVVLLAAALLDNAASIVAYLADWELRQGAEHKGAYLSALRQSAAHLWHWLAVFAPIPVAAAALAALKAPAGRPPWQRR